MYPRVEDAKMLMTLIMTNGEKQEQVELVDVIGEILANVSGEVLIKSLEKLEHRKEGE